MNAKTVMDEYETPAIGIEVAAVAALDGSASELTYRNNPRADKLLYAKAFQAWAEGQIEGNAEDVFEAVQEVLDTSQ